MEVQENKTFISLCERCTPCLTASRSPSIPCEPEGIQIWFCSDDTLPGAALLLGVPDSLLPSAPPQGVSAQERSQEVGSSAAHAGPSPALRFWRVTGADPGDRGAQWLQLCGILGGLSVLCLGFSGVLLLNPPSGSGLSPAHSPGCFHYCIPLSVSIISLCLCPSSVSHWAS